MDYSHLRLNNESELKPFLVEMGKKEFDKYLERVYGKIMRMKSGERFRIDDLVIEENRELFIKLLCLFIWMHGTETFIFSNDYQYFIRK